MNTVKNQKIICKKYKSIYTPCDPALTMGINLQSLEFQPIYGVRIKPTKGISGWFIWGGEYSEDPSFFQSVHGSHIIEMIPSLEKYLGLQPGYKFIIDNQGYEDVWFDPSAFGRAGQQS